MRLLLLQILLIFLVSAIQGQTFIKSWYGKNGEKLFFSKDTKYIHFQSGELKLITSEIRLISENEFQLGEAEYKKTWSRSTDESQEQKHEKVIKWYTFKVIKLSVDTLILQYDSLNPIRPNKFKALTLFSAFKIQEIRNPVFISLQYQNGGLHVSIDSTGYVKYWFDSPNSLNLKPNKVVEGKLSPDKLENIIYWFREEEMQELPEYIGSAADGSYRQLIIQAIPKIIFAYGNGAFPDKIEFGLIKFLSNISREIILKE